MTKWADFLVSAVRYSDDRNRIDQLRVHADLDDRIGPGDIWLLPTLLNALKSGLVVHTVHRDCNCDLVKGGRLRTIELDGEIFVRTDDVIDRADLLDTLPEF